MPRARAVSFACSGVCTSGAVAISTSGNSKNVINGVITAKKKNALVIGLLGNDGGNLKNIVDIPLIVQTKSTARIQEVHRVIYHILCELVEKELAEEMVNN